ncbi:MAG: cation:proton antiporter [wastewater metagenome]|nr:cation:proton antiporter [Candidatus Loosdrechtia aerotolerans]
MHIIKLKQIFAILLIFLFYFYGIWLPQGKAEKVSITKDSEHTPANNKKEIHASNTHVKYHQTVDKKPSQDIVEEKIPSPDTAEGKNIQENPSASDDSQEIAAEEGISSATSPVTLSDPPPNEEISVIEEEKEDQTPVWTSSPSPSPSATEKKKEDQTPVIHEEEKEEEKYTWKIWHSDPTHSIILAVVITLVAAKIGGLAAKVIRLPGVVGKLMVGILLGNICLLTGSDFFDFLKTLPFIKMVSYFGTLILLLTAGLHTDLRALLRVGPSSFLVCLGGIAAPAGLGIIVSYFLLPDASNGTKLLLAVVLGSTSTGLLFAILNELKAMNSLEGRVIVGATILSEIIVILIFGVISGIVVKGGISLLGISVSFGIALLFLIIAIVIIFKYGEKLGSFLTNRLTEGLNIPIVVILSLLVAFMFGSIGLHTVIGAFIAGLLLRNVKLKDSDDREYRNVESFIRPFYMILVPILFVRVGAQVDLRSFFHMDAVLLGLAITGAAIIGKLFCSICPIEKGINRLAIGIGMATKLEGTLILAGIGRDIGILNDTVFSSLIMVIVLTSTICPFLMKIVLLKKKTVYSENISAITEKKELKKVTVH